MFVPACRRAGFGAVHSIPMHRHERVIGAVTLFAAAPGPLDPSTASILRALTDVTTSVLVHQRSLHHQHVVIEQLQLALTSRITLEQAKGVLAERTGLTPDQAFDAMRGYARAHHLGLAGLARDIVAGRARLPAHRLTPDAGPPPARDARRSAGRPGA